MKSKTNTCGTGRSTMAYSHSAMQRALSLGQMLGLWFSRRAS